MTTAAATLPPAAPDAPSLVWTYTTPVRALLIRAAYQYAAPGKPSWTDSAGVRAVDVLGLDAKPKEATRALVEFREGSARRKTWVSLAHVARTPAAAAEKLNAHFSALLATRAPSKMAVTTVASGADEPFLPVPAGYCPECWRKGRSSGLTAAGGLCALAHKHDATAPNANTAAAS